MLHLTSKRLKRVLLVAAVVYMLALFTVGVKAVNELQSAQLENPVTNDGSIGANEWTDASDNEFDPFFGIGADYGKSHVYIKNDEEFLYICFDQAKAPESPGIGIWVVGIDVNYNRDWDEGVDMSFVSLYNETNTEMPWIGVHQNASAIYANWTMCCIFNSTIHPGMACNGTISDDDHAILEWTIPLDLIGVDAAEGGTLGFMFIYLAQDANLGMLYLNLWPSSPQAKWTDDDGTPVPGAMETWGDLVIPEYGAPTCPAGQHWDEEQGQCVPDVTPPEGIPVWVYAAVAVVVIVVVVVAVFMLRRK